MGNQAHFKRKIEDGAGTVDPRRLTLPKPTTDGREADFFSVSGSSHAVAVLVGLDDPLKVWFSVNHGQEKKRSNEPQLSLRVVPPLAQGSTVTSILACGTNLQMKAVADI